MQLRWKPPCFPVTDSEAEVCDVAGGENALGYIPAPTSKQRRPSVYQEFRLEETKLRPPTHAYMKTEMWFIRVLQVNRTGSCRKRPEKTRSRVKLLEKHFAVSSRRQFALVPHIVSFTVRVKWHVGYFSTEKKCTLINSTVETRYCYVAWR